MLFSDRSNKLKQIFSFFFIFLLRFELLWFFFLSTKSFGDLFQFLFQLSTICFAQTKANMQVQHFYSKWLRFSVCAFVATSFRHSLTLSLCVFILFIFAYSCRALHIFSLICCFVYFSLLLLYFVFSGFVRFESEF